MNRLYQWLSGRASIFRTASVGSAMSRTVSTQVTVQTESTTLMAGTSAAFDLCPFCGQKLARSQAVHERLSLHESSIPEKREDG
jgi:hypothetical protein